MAKKKGEINPLSGPHLRELIKEKGESNISIAKKFGYTPEHISQILRGHKRLTEPFAEALSKAYPDYPIEYLLGIARYKSESLRVSEWIRTEAKESKYLFTGLSAFATLNGYIISPPQLEADCSDIANAVMTEKRGYEIKKDSQSVELSIKEFRQFEKEVCDFVELKLKHLLQEKEMSNNG